MTPAVVERTSHLASPIDEVWAHASTFAGIDAELRPITMSPPPDGAGLTAGDVPLGRPWFTSTLRLGPVPFDRHRLCLVTLDPPHGFVEESTSLLHRRWRHERVLTAVPGGCDVTDRVVVVARLPLATRPTGAVVGAVFGRRHRVLRARFGQR